MTSDGKTVLCEIGVGPLGMAYGALAWNDPSMHLLMFEPHPAYYAEVKAAAGARTNVEFHNVAIGDEPGTLSLYDEGTSSALVGVGSPSLQHHGDRPRKEHTVQVRRLSDYDHGQIDMLRIDTEGAEWFALKHLVSRPRQIVLETYNDLGTYINPYLFEIVEWAAQNGYKLANIAEGDFTYHYAGVRAPRPSEPPQARKHDLTKYVTWVKGTIIAAFTQAFLNELAADAFVTTLHRVFERKQKVFANVAAYVKREVEERGKPLQQTLNNVAFFAFVLKDYLDKNNGQQIEGHT